MPEPQKLDYAPPPKRWSRLALLTAILGIASGPLAVGLAILLASLGSDVPGIVFGMIVPFLLTAFAWVYALGPGIETKDRRMAVRGLIVAGIWLVLLVGFVAYCAWDLSRNPL